jgi:hypothetical protein
MERKKMKIDNKTIRIEISKENKGNNERSVITIRDIH